MSIKQLIIFFGTIIVLLECSLEAATTENTIHSPSRNNYKIVCYFDKLGYNDEGPVKFDIEDIDPYQCTHLISDFDPSNDDKPIRSQYPRLDLNEAKTGDFLRFTNLKRNNSELKTLLHVEFTNSTEFDNIVSSRESRKNFIDGYVELLKKYNFDGLDLAWKLAFNTGTLEEREEFYTLLREMREEFNKHNLLLTILVRGHKYEIDINYDIHQISQYFDFINVASFDYRYSIEHFTRHQTGIYARPGESALYRRLNVNFTINYLRSLGAPPEKLNLGMNLLGKYYTLTRKENHGLYADIEYDPRGPRALRYDEICEKQKTQNWTVVYDPHFMAPYAYHEREWVSYDDIESLTLKVSYAKNLQLGGAMVWSIGTDDFRGTCNGEKYPMLSAINDGFRTDLKLSKNLQRTKLPRGTGAKTKE